MSENFFGVELETGRYDGGRGWWLRGDGQGNFTAVPGQESGILAYGEGRGLAVGDYDRDGRVDVVLSQNGAGTKLYRNVKGKPGLRVRLRGGAGNRNGIGAVVRGVSGRRLGPAREVHGGSGYWSQDSAVVVVTAAAGVEQVWVRWPGGKTCLASVPAGAQEVEIDATGQATRVR